MWQGTFIFPIVIALLVIWELSLQAVATRITDIKSNGDDDTLNVYDDSISFQQEQHTAHGNRGEVLNQYDEDDLVLDETEDDEGLFDEHGNLSNNADEQGQIGTLGFAMVCTMDGNVHGVNSGLKRRWKASLGEPTIRTFQRPDTTASGTIIVGEDGSLYIFNANAAPGDEMKKIHTVSQMVEKTPFHQLPIDGDGSNGLGVYIVGKKSTKIFQLDSATGEIMGEFASDESDKIQKKSDSNKSQLDFGDLETDEVEENFDQTGKDVVSINNAKVKSSNRVANGPSVAIARHDYTVRAFDPQTQVELWNVTYSEFSLPSTSLDSLSDRALQPIGASDTHPNGNAMAWTPWRWDESRVVAAFGTAESQCSGDCGPLFTLVPDDTVSWSPEREKSVHVQSHELQDGKQQLYASLHGSFVNVNSKIGGPFVSASVPLYKAEVTPARGGKGPYATTELPTVFENDEVDLPIETDKISKSTLNQLEASNEASVPLVLLPHSLKCNDDGVNTEDSHSDLTCKVGGEYVVRDISEQAKQHIDHETHSTDSSQSFWLLTRTDLVIMAQSFFLTSAVAWSLIFVIYRTYRFFNPKPQATVPFGLQTANTASEVAKPSFMLESAPGAAIVSVADVSEQRVPIVDQDDVQQAQGVMDDRTVNLKTVAGLENTNKSGTVSEQNSVEVEPELPAENVNSTTSDQSAAQTDSVSSGVQDITQASVTSLTGDQESSPIVNTSIDANADEQNSFTPSNDSKNKEVMEEEEEAIEEDEDVQKVGHLMVHTNRIKGHGCQGTTVFEGSFGGRPVAVKRMLKSFFGSAKKEIDLLIRLDGHPNIVRYFAKEESRDFIYLALELCSTTLDLAIRQHIQDQRQFSQRDKKKNSKSRKGRKKAPAKDTEFEGVVYSSKLDSTLQFIEAMCSAIMHLHQSRIVHLDIKPQNILVVPKTEAHPHGPPLEASRGPTTTQSDAMKSHPHPDGSKTGRKGMGDLWLPKISDMGLGKRIGDTTSSIRFTQASIMEMKRRKDAVQGGNTSAGTYDTDGDLGTGEWANIGPQGNGNASSIIGVGTVGWRAAELLGVGIAGLGETAAAAAAEAMAEAAAEVKAGLDPDEVKLRWSRKVDIFSLGCIIQYVLANATHPFGDVVYEREQRIICDSPIGLQHLRDIPEAQTLVRNMVSIKPSERPTIEEVVSHPALWRTSKKLQFMLDLSDRLEPEEINSPIVQAFEEQAEEVIGKRGWHAKLHPIMQAEVAENKYRKYNYSSLRDLLRVIRNKKSHFRDLEDETRALLSPMPYGFMDHFCRPDRFPKLVIVCYEFVLKTMAHEKEFVHYLCPAVYKRCAEASREWAANAKSITCAGNWYLPELQWIHLDSAQNNAKLAKRPQDVVGVVPQFNHKTSLCQHWEKSKGTSCPHAAKCIFAHGLIELRTIPRVNTRSNPRGEGLTERINGRSSMGDSSPHSPPEHRQRGLGRSRSPPSSPSRSPGAFDVPLGFSISSPTHHNSPPSNGFSSGSPTRHSTPHGTESSSPAFSSLGGSVDQSARGNADPFGSLSGSRNRTAPPGFESSYGVGSDPSKPALKTNSRWK